VILLKNDEVIDFLTITTKTFPQHDGAIEYAVLIDVQTRTVVVEVTNSPC